MTTVLDTLLSDGTRPAPDAAVTAYPEIIARRRGRWAVIPSSEMAAVDLRRRVLYVPSDTTPRARRARAHELAHVALTPPKDLGREAHRIGVSPLVLNAVEDARITSVQARSPHLAEINRAGRRHPDRNRSRMADRLAERFAASGDPRAAPLYMICTAAAPEHGAARLALDRLGLGELRRELDAVLAVVTRPGATYKDVTAAAQHVERLLIAVPPPQEDADGGGGDDGAPSQRDDGDGDGGTTERDGTPERDDDGGDGDGDGDGDGGTAERGGDGDDDGDGDGDDGGGGTSKRTPKTAAERKREQRERERRARELAEQFAAGSGGRRSRRSATATTTADDDERTADVLAEVGLSPDGGGFREHADPSLRAASGETLLIERGCISITNDPEYGYMYQGPDYDRDLDIEVAPVWGEMKIARPPLAERVAMPRRHRARRAVAADNGHVGQGLHRAYTDGRALRRRTWDRARRRAGTLLIDMSGSMSLGLDELQRLLAEAPYATIAGYAADDSGDGTLRVLAQHGRHVSADVLRAIRDWNNGIDLPALRWLARQPAPRIWVSDGYIIAGRSNSTGIDSLSQCHAACRHAGIVRVANIETLLGDIDAVEHARVSI